MKKTLILAAVLALATTPAFATTDVNIPIGDWATGIGGFITTFAVPLFLAFIGLISKDLPASECRISQHERSNRRDDQRDGCKFQCGPLVGSKANRSGSSSIRVSVTSSSSRSPWHSTASHVRRFVANRWVDTMHAGTWHREHMTLTRLNARPAPAARGTP